MQVPDNVGSLGLDGNQATNRNLTRLFAKPRKLRVALLLAVGVTPLMVFAPGDMLKHSVCVEEALFVRPHSVG
jgi:hypothetical protein